MAKDGKTNQRLALQSQIVKDISNAEIKSKMHKPGKWNFIGRMLQNAAVKKFEKQKLDALKGISKRQQGLVTRGFEAARDVATTLIASDTAKELNRGDSYRNSLAAWAKNFNGNPNPEEGSDGQTQGGSTSELGG